MNESELYKELGILTKDKSKWEENIPYVSSLLDHDSVKIQAKALWLLGEMGLEYPDSIRDAVSAVALFCDSEEAILRERAVNALGRIGRGSYGLIETYWKDLFRFASDNEPKVRLSFIWASENIATNTPDIYENHMSVFEPLLHDIDDKVRMESPEIFRVLGKRRPEFVIPYIEQLQKMAESDSNRVVRIHSLGAIKATAQDLIYLTEADERYADELEKFKDEVLAVDKDKDDQFAGCYGLRNCATAREWIDICNLRKNDETCGQADTQVPSTTYFAIRYSDNKLVGVIDLRHHIDHPVLASWGGHCGYSVRPSERGKGYGTEMLRQNVLNAAKLGIRRMLVVCDEDNTASEKIILANGGHLDNIIEVNGCRMRRFWIDTDQSLSGRSDNKLYV